MFPGFVIVFLWAVANIRSTVFMCAAVKVRVLFTSWCLPDIGLFLIAVCPLLLCAIYELLPAHRGLFILKVPKCCLVFLWQTKKVETPDIFSLCFYLVCQRLFKKSTNPIQKFLFFFMELPDCLKKYKSLSIVSLYFSFVCLIKLKMRFLVQKNDEIDTSVFRGKVTSVF